MVKDTTKKIRPMRRIAVTNSAKENSSRNKLFLQQQQNHLRIRSKRLTSKEKLEIKKALKKIKTFEKAPFLLAFSFAMMSMILSAYSQISSILIESVEFVANLIKLIPWIGWVIGTIVDVSFQAVGFGITIFVSLLQFVVTVYIAYFRWKYSTFLEKYLLKRYTWIFVPFLSLLPIASLIPWPMLSLYILHKQLKKRAKEGKKVLKKYHIKY